MFSETVLYWIFSECCTSYVGTVEELSCGWDQDGTSTESSIELGLAGTIMGPQQSHP